MNSEEKIMELTKRIEVLEAQEKKRKTKKNIKLAYEITKIVIILILFLGSYLYINAKVIKPYKETTENISEKISEKAKDIESSLETKIDKIKDLFKR